MRGPLLLRNAALLTSLARAASSVAPVPEAELLLVQVVHRHGDRSPITPMADRDFWVNQRPSQAALAAAEAMTLVVSAEKAESAHPAAGDGTFGTLTSRGLQGMFGVGEGLRQVEYYQGVIPEAYESRNVSVLSTNFPRTVQSVQALLSGLYPAVKRPTPIEIDVSFSSRMIPDPKPRATREQEELEAEVLRSDEEEAALAEPLRRRLSEALAPVVAPLASRLGGFGTGDTASDDGLLSWNKVAEVMTCLHAYDRLPEGLTAADVAAASAQGARRWTKLMRHPRIVELAMGDMADKIVETARAVADGRSELRLQVRRCAAGD